MIICPVCMEQRGTSNKLILKLRVCSWCRKRLAEELVATRPLHQPICLSKLPTAKPSPLLFVCARQEWFFDTRGKGWGWATKPRMGWKPLA
jgi:hypothetical protein